MSQKEEKALRVFEALNEVDEELLLRSEKNAEKKPGKIFRFQTMSRVAAACLGFLVVGGVFLAVQNNSQMKSQTPMAEGIRFSAMENQNGRAEIAEFDAADTAIRLETDEEAVPEEMKRDGADGITQNQTVESCLEAEVMELTPEQAKAEKLGAYLPEYLPAGYVFEDARLYLDAVTGESTELYECWSKGYDDIRIWVSRVSVDEIAFVDVKNTASYDVYAYEIPYEDSVPGEYYEAFFHPVFRASDMTRELIGKRMKSVKDAGDTTTPRGNFAVWFEEGILWEFNGSADPRDVWAMLESACEASKNHIE